MRLLRLQISVLFVLLSQLLVAQSQYVLQVISIDKDSAQVVNELKLKTRFENQYACREYIDQLPLQLSAAGYMAHSIDSVWYDSLSAKLFLYAGEKFEWSQLNVDQISPTILNGIGWRPTVFNNQPLQFSTVTLWQEKILNYLENNGHPFAKVFLDSVVINGKELTAALKVQEGLLYRIDSIRVIGNGKIANRYLQKYLELPNGVLYSKEKITSVGKKIRELSFVEEERPLNISYKADGAVLNLYLKQRKNSQMNVLIGLLPNNDQLQSKKMMVTGEANILLKNAFGAGETIGFNWQQLQVKSPRLNLLFQYPFLFNTPIGANLSFDMFRKDSTFVNINFHLGAEYFLNANQSGQIYLQRFSTIVNGVNTSRLLATRQLPNEGDVSLTNIGIEYVWNATDYKRNPRRGNELQVNTSIGTKQLKKNNQILELKDPADPSFDFGSLYDTLKLKTNQFKIVASAAKYFPMGLQSTIKTALNGGFIHSPSIFRNELFQIGGYKLLRGFDEESQYLSQYLVGTVEYRLLAGSSNSYFYVLADAAWGKNNSVGTNTTYTYYSTGAGLAFENKVGVFNIAWAIGKRSDTKFDFRQSKIHLGFVNYF